MQRSTILAFLGGLIGVILGALVFQTGTPRIEEVGLNTEAHEYSPSLSPDGRFIAFVSERLGGEGERDIYLYDRRAQKLLPTPGLNSKTEDFDPCVIVGEAP